MDRGPESVMDEPDDLRGWLRKALAYTSTLPAKTKLSTTAAKPRGRRA